MTEQRLTEVRLVDGRGDLKYVFRWKPAADEQLLKLSPKGDGSLRVDKVESVACEPYWYLVPKPQSGNSRRHTEAEAAANGGVARKPLQAPYPLTYGPAGSPHRVKLGGRELRWEKVVAALDVLAASATGPDPLELPVAKFLRCV